MDTESLCRVLAGCTSPDPAVRQASEQQLGEAQKLPGALVGFLSLTTNPNLDIALRQAAAITFKNVVARAWEDRTEEEKQSILVPKEEKAAIRSHLLDALAHAPPLIRTQLAECVKSIVYADYPGEWPDILQTIVGFLGSNEQNKIYGALLALRQLTRKYEFRVLDDREQMSHIVSTAFPTLLNLFQQLLAMDSPSPERGELLKLICKNFWSATYLFIPPLLVQHDQFLGWMTCLLQLVMLQVPNEGQPADTEGRRSWPWWKCKKWALHVSYRIFSRYGSPAAVKSLYEGEIQQIQEQFAAMFHNECATNFLEAHLLLLSNFAQGQYMTSRVVNLAVQFVGHAVQIPAMHKLVKGQVNDILLHVIFPLLCFNDEDATLWAEDPQEYVRKGYDIIEDLYSPRTAAVNFLTELCAKKKIGKQYLQMFITFLAANQTGILSKHASMPGDGPLARQTDGAMLAIGSLSEILKRSIFKGDLENMLKMYIVPEFQSQFGFLRAKACWVSQQFADLKFTDGKGDGPTFRMLFECIVRALQDPELPVRVDAVVALRTFVDEASTLDFLKEILPHLLDELFKLMDEVDNEDLVFTLETIVENLGEEIAPYALGLCTSLSNAFWKCIQSEDEGEDEIGAMAAVGCLRAIATILESVNALPHLYPAMEEILFPIMSKLISTEGQDVLEEVLDIVSYFTYFTPEISPRMWELWPQMIVAMNDWAMDYFENMLIPMDNYVSRGTERFLTCKDPDYVGSVAALVHKAFFEYEADESEIVPAPKLLCAVIQNCKGGIDDYLEQYLLLSLRKLQGAESVTMKDLLVEVVASALFYNPALTLQLLQKHDALHQFFDLWFHNIFATNKKGTNSRHFRREYDKHVCVLGLASLYTLPSSALPAELQAGEPRLISGILKLLLDLKGLREKRIQEEAESSEEEESDDEAEDNEDLEEEDDEEDEYLAKLAKKAHGFSWVDGDDDEDEDLFYVDDDEFSTPLDKVDPFVFFSDVLGACKTQEPSRFQALASHLEPQTLQLLDGALQHAEVRRQEIAKEVKK
mmetsp:Transcript_2416/g.16258  ORF Transcript_2416/g.16258 Transcript_2416/m.16258 type:complete len:1039 (-) Transcript_2416:1522-4638(-)